MTSNKKKPGAWHRKKVTSKLHRRMLREQSKRRKTADRPIRTVSHEIVKDEKTVRVRRKPLVFRAFPEQTRATGALKRHEKRAVYLDKLNQEKAACE
jgi:hypothetical protein